jgi:hypothetical protein
MGTEYWVHYDDDYRIKDIISSKNIQGSCFQSTIIMVGNFLVFKCFPDSSLCSYYIIVLRCGVFDQRGSGNVVTSII